MRSPAQNDGSERSSNHHHNTGQVIKHWTACAENGSKTIFRQAVRHPDYPLVEIAKEPLSVSKLGNAQHGGESSLLRSFNLTHQSAIVPSALPPCISQLA